MADGATTPSRLGQAQGTGDALALFLKKFSGEVLATYDELCVMKDKSRVRTIENGKSAQFPVLGTATAAYHVPGESLLETGEGATYLSKVHAAERVINIDSKLTSATFIADIDEAMNHYDVRSEYAHQMGQALANKYDKQLLQLTALGARAAPTITAQTNKDGDVAVDADFNTNAASAIATIAAVAQQWDEKDVPSENRYAFVSPAAYYALAQNTSILSRDWNAPNGGIAQGKVFQVAGVNIVKTNHIPNANLSQETGTNNTYHGDFSLTLALFLQTDGLGTVKLRDLKMEAEYQIERQGTLMVASYALGHGILRPECCFEVTSA